MTAKAMGSPSNSIRKSPYGPPGTCFVNGGREDEEWQVSTPVTLHAATRCNLFSLLSARDGSGGSHAHLVEQCCALVATLSRDAVVCPLLQY